MTAPHIRDLNLPDWHEVPEGVTIPAGTRYFCTFPSGGWLAVNGPTDYRAANRTPGARYFTADPIPDPREAEIETEARRLWLLAYPGGEWPGRVSFDYDAFRRLAVESLDRQAARE